MYTDTRKMIQNAIITQLGVKNDFNSAREAKHRIQFLRNYLFTSQTKGYVLGISGGVDSTTAGTMAQLAVDSARTMSHDAKFIAVRLPYGIQKDEADAQKALAIIGPDIVLTVDIKPAVDAIMDSLELPNTVSAAQYDFIKGNVKARQRMVVQYAIAGEHNALVIGTDHASEAVMGFFTKFGDGACDVTPLAGATKHDVRNMARVLGVPDHLVEKAPTADLEDLRPGLLDEVAYGVTYDDITAFLHGEDVSDHVYNTIIAQYQKTQHKRDLPYAPK